MALASLIIGCAPLETGAEPRAALKFLGQSLVEYQARQAAAAGAKHIVILVERVPAALVAAVDRLKREGLGVELARSVADAADRIHPDERLLLIGDGVVVRQDVLFRAARANVPSLFTLPDSGSTLDHERIDATSRFAGFALIDGTLLRRTAAMLGDWDLQSTLLRKIVQAQPTRIEAGIGSVWLIDTPAEGRSAEIALLGGGANRLLPVALAEKLSATLLDRDVKPGLFRLGALALGVMAIIAFAAGWIATGALLMTLTGPLAALPRRIEEVGLRTDRQEKLWRFAQSALCAIGLLVLAWVLQEAGAGWGVWPIALATIGLSGLLWDQSRITGLAPPQPAWTALLLLVFAIPGWPVLGMAATALFVGWLLGWRQRRIPGPADV